jgi:hypothetical protein
MIFQWVRVMADSSSRRSRSVARSVVVTSFMHGALDVMSRTSAPVTGSGRTYDSSM